MSTCVFNWQMREMEILSTSTAHSEVGGNGEAASSDPSLASAALALMQQRAAAAVAAYYPYPQAVIPSQARLSLSLIFTYKRLI